MSHSAARSHNVNEAHITRKFHPNEGSRLYLLMMSVNFVVAENFLIKTFRCIRRKYNINPEQQDAMREIIVEEGEHTKAHRTYNLGYAKLTGHDVSAYGYSFAKALELISFKNDPLKNLYVCLFFERFFACVAELLITSRFFDDLAPEEQALFKWHLSEEVLHVEKVESICKIFSYQPRFTVRLVILLRIIIPLVMIYQIHIAVLAFHEGSLKSKVIWKAMFDKDAVFIRTTFFRCAYSILFNKTQPISRELQKECIDYLRIDKANQIASN